ncbi:hypothetical protein, conserved [Leishmania tarentolae]|uniref:Uncharacterized protein n=1 Tax=Leishmania tarentolae TaxID=5689 RepID=A0A640K9I5_LEITA|nr:hypothetical protein, conserved [Leishmania tarentolae]
MPTGSTGGPPRPCRADLQSNAQTSSVRDARAHWCARREARHPRSPSRTAAATRRCAASGSHRTLQRRTRTDHHRECRGSLSCAERSGDRLSLAWRAARAFAVCTLGPAVAGAPYPPRWQSLHRRAAEIWCSAVLVGRSLVFWGKPSPLPFDAVPRTAAVVLRSTRTYPHAGVARLLPSRQHYRLQCRCRRVTFSIARQISSHALHRTSSNTWCAFADCTRGRSAGLHTMTLPQKQDGATRPTSSRP